MSTPWLILWAVLATAGLAFLAWLADRLGGPHKPDDEGSEAHYLDEVEARSHFPYL